MVIVRYLLRMVLLPWELGALPNVDSPKKRNYPQSASLDWMPWDFAGMLAMPYGIRIALRLWPSKKPTATSHSSASGIVLLKLIEAISLDTDLTRNGLLLITSSVVLANPYVQIVRVISVEPLHPGKKDLS